MSVHRERLVPNAVDPLSSETDSDIELAPGRSRSVLAVVLVSVVACGLVAGLVANGSSQRSLASRSDSITWLKANESFNQSECSWGLQNCNETKCCNNPGKLCYEQGPWYAQCRDTCVPDAPDPKHWDGTAWTCKELGERSAGDGSCAEFGEDCSVKQCCAVPGTQCFEKNDGWATCKSECISGAPDLGDTDGDAWSCKKLGAWNEGASDWVADQCSPMGDDCRETKCCSDKGATCYKQTDFWSECKYDCTEGKDPQKDWEPEWACDVLGYQTPGDAPAPGGMVAQWVSDDCAGTSEDCLESKCCKGMNEQCYKKDDDWAMCMQDCTRGKHPDDNNETWSCDILGPRSINGLAIKGSPSLFCWSLFQTTTYENDIIKRQYEEGLGIFLCDGYAILSTDEPVTFTKKGRDNITSLWVEQAEITTSQDGTAGNAKLFINCWNALINDGDWRHFAWNIKVDPDAVIVPDRVRDHIRGYVLENVYVVNCNAFPSSPNFPMMYGSVEIYTFKAIDTYATNFGQCMDDMGMMLPQWGEDYYMTHCLDHIGVGRISDFVSVGDNVCSGGSCFDSAFSAFHPYKTVDEWQQCWDATQGLIEPPQPEWEQEW